MNARADRAARISAAALEHPIVQFAADAMDARDDDAIVPDAQTVPAITKRLASLREPEDLIAAVLGLAQFAALLRLNDGAEAADALMAAIRGASEHVATALQQLPDLKDAPAIAAVVQATAGDKLAAFRGDARASFERRAPAAGEVKATHAALSLRAGPSRKKPPR